ncbi:MAG TPA: histidine kinase [Anaeromyxobacteraceae bacterium]|nr:histidine kinase [Anaeromyxobacteraceae bacterium]
MHPVLSERRAVVLYLATWVVASYLPASLLAASGGSRFFVALAASVVPTVLLGVGALPLYYVCRALQLRSSTAGLALRVHGVLGLLFGAAWWGLLWVAAALLDGSGPDALRQEVERRWGALLVLGALLYLAAMAFYTVVSSVQQARDSEKRAAAASLRAQEMQLTLLKAQVHPHFLFNSLNAVSALTVQEPRLARELCVLLADFLRGCLATGEQATVSLSEELRLARSYLDIERVRLGDRLTVDIRVSPPAGEVRVPALLLQPLVENAITHGIATCARGGTLAIEARTTPGTLVVTVTNPFDPDAPARHGQRPGGVGLANVSRRIAAAFRGATLTTRRDVDRFTSTLVLPIDPTPLPPEAS